MMELSSTQEQGRVFVLWWTSRYDDRAAILEGEYCKQRFENLLVEDTTRNSLKHPSFDKEQRRSDIGHRDG